MGTKLISLDAIKFSDIRNEQGIENIVFDDLVRTLKMDPEKYQKPALDKDNKVVRNEIYALAAWEAKLTHMVVETPELTHYFEPEKTSDEILKNYVFFKKEIFEHSGFIELSEIFDNYLKRCKIAVDTVPLRKGTVTAAEFFPSKDKDLISYVLRGKLNPFYTTEIFSKAEKTLHTNLEIIVGAIRSINGIKYAPYG